jgi:serpin B
MFERATRRSSGAAERSQRCALRTFWAVIAAGLLAAACASTAVSPSPGASAGPTGWPASLPWGPPTYWAVPSMSFWQPEPTQAETPAPSPTRTMRPLSQSVGFPLIRGNAPLAEPAGDYGADVGPRINDFGFDLLRGLPADGNLCVSPTSIALDLAMVRAGARGNTATQMDKVLHSFGAPGQEAEIVALMEQLQRQTILVGSGFDDPGANPDPNAPPLVELDVANQVFAQKGMTLEQAYLDSLSSSFNAGVGILDFTNDPEAARQTINNWASENTHGRIPEPLHPGDIGDGTRIAIANAIYLKAAWEAPFDPANTKPRPFHTASGATLNVPTMAEQGALFYYTSGSGYRAVGLPFGSMGIGMTIVVPDDMGTFTSSLTAARLAALTGGMSIYTVDLTMPRFSLDTRFDLAETLAGMGMPSLFSEAADLSGITTDEPLMIDKVIHQANIDVLEDGVTAAAVTITLGRATSGGPPPYVKFQIDKPFLYFLSEQESGTILFMGRVNNPSVK